MKNFIALLLLTYSTLIFAQKSNVEDEQVLENLNLEMTIDSLEDLNDFNLIDIRDIFNQSKKDQPIEFSIECNNIISQNSKLTSNLSFTVKGNSNKTDALMKKIKAIKKNLKKYYNHKKSNR